MTSNRFTNLVSSPSQTIEVQDKSAVADLCLRSLKEEDIVRCQVGGWWWWWWVF
jgi:hypothetical protein